MFKRYIVLIIGLSASIHAATPAPIIIDNQSKNCVKIICSDDPDNKDVQYIHAKTTIVTNACKTSNALACSSADCDQCQGERGSVFNATGLKAGETKDIPMLELGTAYTISDTFAVSQMNYKDKLAEYKKNQIVSRPTKTIYYKNIVAFPEASGKLSVQQLNAQVACVITPLISSEVPFVFSYITIPAGKTAAIIVPKDCSFMGVYPTPNVPEPEPVLGVNYSAKYVDSIRGNSFYYDKIVDGTAYTRDSETGFLKALPKIVTVKNYTNRSAMILKRCFNPISDTAIPSIEPNQSGKIQVEVGCVLIPSYQAAATTYAQLIDGRTYNWGLYGFTLMP